MKKINYDAIQQKEFDEAAFSDLQELTEEKALEILVESMNERIGDLNRFDGIECDVCKNKGFVYYVLNGYRMVNDCECVSGRKIVLELEKSGLYHEFKTKRLDNYEVTEQFQRVIKEKAVDYIENGAKYWFVALGQSGAGKTHICTAISKALIDRGNTFEYFPFARKITDISNGLRSFNQIAKEEAEYQLNKYRRTDVLYIDDFLKVDTRIDVVFDLIDYRYSNQLTTIISSEKQMKDLLNYDVAIAGRIREMTNNNKYLVDIKKDMTRNYRMKNMEEI